MNATLRCGDQGAHRALKNGAETQESRAGNPINQIAVKAWYADGTNKVATVNVLVTSELPGGPIIIVSPASCATVSSPVHVIASENTAERATVMQIYVDGVLAVERPGVERVDEIIPLPAGSHWVAVKAWYAGGCSRVVSVYITVSSTRHRSAHATEAGAFSVRNGSRFSLICMS